MSSNLSPSSSGAGPSSEKPQPAPAAPPTRLEIERKLSFKSAAGPRQSRSLTESPKKTKKAGTNAPPSSYAMSGNDSDTSSITSSTHPQLTSPTHPSSPLLTPNTGSVGGLSAIAEKGKGPYMDLDEMELHDVEEEGEGDGEDDGESEADEVAGGDLQRGMEGERVLKSGYLMKKQERRKAWKRRWFVLRTGKLAYYKDDREYSLKKVLDLKSIQTVAPVTVKKHSFSFGIVTSKRTFLAKASSQDEMDDWVRAINNARRKLSEREEEDRVKRTGVNPVPVPMRDRPEAVETHPGTYGSVFSTTTGGSITSSPVTTTGYFPPHPGGNPSNPRGGSPISSPIGLPGLPPSPMEFSNSLTGQVAMMSLNKSPSLSSGARMPQSRVVSAASARREPSASSISSSAEYHPMSGGLVPVGVPAQQAPSSDEDEPYYTEPNAAFASASPNPANISAAPVDPNKVILSAYLMKRSKGRTTGRKVWRKRWFYLTSQGLTYTKSHMDSRALRFIPLSAVLDALEFDPNGSGDDATDSDPDAPGASSSPPPALSFSTSRRGRDGTPAKRVVGDKPGASGDENLFRLITAKRAYVLCAPSEEDEIKWLAAFRALLNRQRDWSGDGAPPQSPTLETSPRLPGLSQHVKNVPTITQQPPTPAGTQPSSLHSADTPAGPATQGPPVLARPVDGEGGAQAPSSLGNRGRSATYIAKGAVADVVRRYHPETPPLPQSTQ